VCVAIVAGCAEESEKETPVVMAGPLDLDPTERIDLTGWWSNGKSMLLLEPDAAYSLWKGTNRYLAPEARGRWQQTNYAELWIEPYGGLQPQRDRVGVTKIDGRPALLVGKMEPMFRLDAPPRSAEDDLIGAWDGERGSLRLDADMRYEFTAARPMNTPVAVTRHRGRWRLDGESVVLEPDTPVVPVTSMRLTRESDAVTRLKGADIEVVRRRVARSS
jgi:hypothetical protein